MDKKFILLKIIIPLFTFIIINVSFSSIAFKVFNKKDINSSIKIFNLYITVDEKNYDIRSNHFLDFYISKSKLKPIKSSLGSPSMLILQSNNDFVNEIEDIKKIHEQYFKTIKAKVMPNIGFEVIEETKQINTSYKKAFSIALMGFIVSIIILTFYQLFIRKKLR